MAVISTANLRVQTAQLDPSPPSGRSGNSDLNRALAGCRWLRHPARSPPGRPRSALPFSSPDPPSLPIPTCQLRVVQRLVAAEERM
eukprot:2968167-Rhodomonas_salina.1